MVNIRQNLVSSGKHNIKCPYAMTKPTSITVHNTANDATSENEIKYMITNDKQVSFHYAVDDKEIVQGIADNRNAWHCGNTTGNRNSLSVEICYSKSGGDKFNKAEQNAAEFIASKLKQYGLKVSNVTTHKAWNGKDCPHRTLSLGWDRFIAMIQKYYDGSGSSSSSSTGSTSSGSSGSTVTDTVYSSAKTGTVKTSSSNLNIRKSASTGATVVGSISKGKTCAVTAEVKPGDGYTWYKITYSGVTGYVRGDYLTVSAGSTSSTNSSSTSSSTSSAYKVGMVYTVTASSGLKIRNGAGTNYAQKKLSEVTADAQKKCKSGTYAVLKNGATVTCKGVSTDSKGNVWIQIPSGYICAKEGSTAYIK